MPLPANGGPWPRKTVAPTMPLVSEGFCQLKVNRLTPDHAAGWIAGAIGASGGVTSIEMTRVMVISRLPATSWLV